MSPKTRDTLSPSTLLLGSLSSAASALVVHEFWRAGAILAAALTPVLVAIFGELFRTPVVHVHARAERLAGPRPVGVRPTATGEALRVYRARPRWRLAVVTGLVAFALGAGGLTLSELLLDRSVGDRSERTTLFDARPRPDVGQQSAAPSGVRGERRESGRDAERTAAPSTHRRGERDAARHGAAPVTTTPATTTTPAPPAAPTVTQPPEQTPQTTPQPAAEPAPQTPAPLDERRERPSS